MSGITPRPSFPSFLQQFLVPGLDVVPGPTRAPEPFDAAIEGLVLIPNICAGAFVCFDFGFGAKDEDGIDRAQDFVGDGIGVFSGEVDATFRGSTAGGLSD
jgi:hypothetical protein